MHRSSLRLLIYSASVVFLASGAYPQEISQGSAQEGKSPDASPKQSDDATKEAKSKATSRINRGRRPQLNPHRTWGQGVVDGSFMGRSLAPVMSYLGADWLIRPEREVEEEPERMLDALALKPGMVVADVGAGVGFTSLRIAKRVAPDGKVLATDIQPEMIRMLRLNTKLAKLDQFITPVLCTADDPKLPENKVDLTIMVDVYHECTHPVETLKGIHKALKPGGRLVLVEFRAEDSEVPILPEHKMSVEQARREVEPRGFVLKQKHDFLPWQHILVFEKVPEPAPASDKQPR